MDWFSLEEKEHWMMERVQIIYRIQISSLNNPLF